MTKRVGRILLKLLLLGTIIMSGGLLSLYLGQSKAQGAVETSQADSCQGENKQPAFGGAVVVGRGEVVCSDIIALGGTVIIQGNVKKDILGIGSQIVIAGDVEGSVTLYGGDLTIQSDAHIGRDIHMCGGQWAEGSNVHLQGSLFDCTKSVGMLLAGNEGSNVRFWYAVILVVLSMILSFLLPEHVMLVRTTAKARIGRSFALGVLSILLAPVVIGVLFALIISIPLAIIVTIGLVIAWALGLVAIGALLGELVFVKFFPQQKARVLQVVVGSALLAIAGALPYLGFIVSIGAGFVGLGAVLLSRFGTRLYGQPKTPLL